MRLFYSTIGNKEEIISYNEIDGLNQLNSYFSIKKFVGVSGEITASKISNIVTIKFDLDIDLTLISSYSLKEFEAKYKLKDTLYFTDLEELENDDVFYIDNNIINIDECIYSLLITMIPLNVHIKGEKLPNVKGVDVVKEEDVKKSSPFDVLDDLDL